MRSFCDNRGGLDHNGVCGDGLIEVGEVCDEGQLNSDIQSNDCRRFWCGDGVIDTNEQCDDGNSTNDDGCNTGCTACGSLNNNLEISSDTRICTQNL